MTPRRSDADRGQTLVEFALMIPIVVLIMVGLFDLGRVVFTNNTLSDGARDGARHAATDPRTDAGYCARVDEAVRSATRGQPLSPYTVTITTIDGDGDPLSTYVVCEDGLNGPDFATMVADDQVGPGDRVTVDLGANVDLVLDVVADAVGRSSFMLAAESTMQVTFAPAPAP
jgi:Flp pilus assembly protein TadG